MVSTYTSFLMLSFLQPLDPILKGLGMTRANFLTIIIVFVLVFFLSVYEEQIYRWKESTKAYLRKQLQGFTVQRHLTENGKTLETSESPSMMSHIVSMIDYVFLAPDKDTEGFQTEDDDDDEDEEDDEEEEEEEEDKDEDEDEDQRNQEGFEDDDEDEEDNDEADVDQIKNLL